MRRQVRVPSQGENPSEKLPIVSTWLNPIEKDLAYLVWAL